MIGPGFSGDSVVQGGSTGAARARSVWMLLTLSGAATACVGLCSTGLCGEADRPQLAGTWSGPTQMLDDEAWAFEDFACFLGCPSETFAFARRLFGDPANFDRSYPELQGEVIRRRAADMVAKLTPAAFELRQAFDPADDPAIRCQPYGLVRQALSPVPIEIIQANDAVTIRYELWSAVRVISLGGDSAEPAAPTRLGRSVGRYEDEALVVETTGVLGDVVAPDARVLHSSDLRAIERYTLADNGDRLDLELTVTDPKTFSEPLTLRAAWRRTPRTRLLPYECHVIGEPP